ncbi:MAG: PAS domain-containing protein, partial [Chitinophagales bacterium]
FILIENMVNASKMMNRTNQATLSLQKIALYITDAETNQRGFLLSGDSILLDKRDLAFATLDKELQDLNSLINNDESQLNDFHKLIEEIDAKKASMKIVLESYTALGTDPRFRMNMLDGVQKMDYIKNSINQMTVDQQILLNERIKIFRQTSQLTPLFAILLMIASILILLSSYRKIIKELNNSKYLQTQLQEQNNKLEERTAFAETILNASVAFVQVFDKDMKLITLNDRALNLYGQSRANMLGKHMEEIVPNFKQTDAYPAVMKALEGEIVHYKQYLSKFTGRYYESFYVPLKKGDNIWGIMISAHDITALMELTEQLKRKNEELSDRNDFVETLINSSVDIIFVLDHDLRYLSVNKKAMEAYSLFGNVIGSTISEVNPLIIQSPIYEDIQQAFKGIAVHREKFKSVTSEEFYTADMIPLTRHSETYAVMVILHDITDFLHTQDELKRSEYQYHLMVGEVENYAIFFLSPEGEIKNWNKGAERIKGYKEEEIIGKNFSIFFTEEDRAKNLPEKILVKAIQDGKAVYEGWRMKKDKSIFWASISLTSLYDEEQKLIGFSKVTRDLTERRIADEQAKKYAEELERKNSTLEKMNQELSAFAYVSSHDLQEPLRKIRTFSARILEKEEQALSETGKDYFKRILLATTRMQNLITDLLSYSRTTTDTRKFEEIDITVLLDDVKDDFKELIRDKNAVIESEPLHKAIVIPFQFRQLLHNLISNSLKFTLPEKPPHIIIKSETKWGREFNEKKLNPAGKYYHMIFADNGIGFDTQYEELIFEVFKRLHSRQEYEGTGIGLAIVKKIVENHNGIITADSAINKGTTFHIYLPLV